MRFRSTPPPPGDWQQRGACLGYAPDLFILDRRELGQTRYEEAKARAVAICAGCPVLEECRAYARKHMPEGIWGGEDAPDRRRAAGKTRTRAAETSSRRCPACLSRDVIGNVCGRCGTRVAG